MPVQRGLGAPIKWVRTARNADIGSSTSMTAKSGSISCRPRLKCGPTIAAEAGEPAKQLGEPLVLDERDVARSRLADRPRRVDRDAAIADQATANQVRELFHRCDHGVFLSSLKGEDENQGVGGEWVLDQPGPVLAPIDVVRNRRGSGGP